MRFWSRDGAVVMWSSPGRSEDQITPSYWPGKPTGQWGKWKRLLSSRQKARPINRDQVYQLAPMYNQLLPGPIHIATGSSCNQDFWQRSWNSVIVSQNLSPSKLKLFIKTQYHDVQYNLCQHINQFQRFYCISANKRTGHGGEKQTLNPDQLGWNLHHLAFSNQTPLRYIKNWLSNRGQKSKVRGHSYLGRRIY